MENLKEKPQAEVLGSVHLDLILGSFRVSPKSLHLAVLWEVRTSKVPVQQEPDLAVLCGCWALECLHAPGLGCAFKLLNC